MAFKLECLIISTILIYLRKQNSDFSKYKISLEKKQRYLYKNNAKSLAQNFNNLSLSAKRVGDKK